MTTQDNILFLENNKSARIWAFDEMIDRNTENDSNTNEKGLTEISLIIDYVLTELLESSNEYEIVTKYKSYLDTNEIIDFNTTFNQISDDYSIFHDLTPMANKYYLCGWTKHNIIIFFNKQSSIEDDNKYEFGIINCGQGANIQGCNNSTCNGIIILKNIMKNNILEFLRCYKKFLLNSSNYDSVYVYKSFYIMLFDKILDTPSVDFKTIDEYYEPTFYKLPIQNIGSCVFTNTINIVYHLYIKKYTNINTSTILEEYLNLYNKIKNIIKKKIYIGITEKKDKTYYNIYKYIIDTDSETDRVRRTNEYETSNVNIVQKIYNYDILNLESELQLLNSEILLDTCDTAFCDIYNNLTSIEVINEAYISHDPNERNQFITLLFYLYSKIDSFDNNMKLLMPLLILYKMKSVDSNIIFDISTLNECMRQYYRISTEHNISIGITPAKIIYICIYVLLIKSQNTNTSSNKNYYNKIPFEIYNEKRNINFKYYNYTVFQYIPIINNFFYEIIKILIRDLYENIEILPDINDLTYITPDKYLVINDQTNTKNLLKYHLLFCRIAFSSILKPIKINNSISNNINFLLWYIFVHNKNDLFNTNENFRFNFEVYGYINHDFILNVPNPYFSSNEQNHNFILNTMNNSIENNPGLYILYTQKIELLFKKIEEKLRKYTINNEYLPQEILKDYIVYFYLCYLQNIEINSTDLFNKYNDIFLKNFHNIYFGPFEKIIKMYICKNNLNCERTKLLFIIDDTTLIPSMEKKLFTLKEYEYEKKIEQGDLYISIIEFRVIYTSDYNLLFFNNKYNTEKSIDIITRILKELPNFSIYLLLNFSFIEKDDYIRGIHKNDETTRIRYIKVKKKIYIIHIMK